MAAPSFDPGPITRLSTPGGKPGALDDVDQRPRRRRCELRRLEDDAVAERERRRDLPRRNRQREIPGRDDATTPTGSRVTSTSTPGRTESSLSPRMRTASPGEVLEDGAGPAASPIASASGLPCSRDSRRPSSSLRARISVPARSRMSNRSCGVVMRPLGERLPRRRDRLRDVGRCCRARTRRRCPCTFEGLISGVRSVESIDRPSISSEMRWPSTSPAKPGSLRPRRRDSRCRDDPVYFSRGSPWQAGDVVTCQDRLSFAACVGSSAATSTGSSASPSTISSSCC